MSNRVGQQHGNYRLIAFLGQGGFAEVYLGEHVYLGTQAAVKVLHARLTSKDQENFLREARTIAYLEHPNIVRLLDFGIEQDRPFLIMNYAPYGSLRQRHPRGTALPLSSVVSYIKQVAPALQYAHDERLIHQDIKPENMLAGRQNSILLSDFGIAIVAPDSSSLSVQGAGGTAPYMAPEQIEGKPRFASDQYALGVVVYEWLCGDRPFGGSPFEILSQHLYASPPPLREKVPTLPPMVERIVLRALAKDPHQRYARVQDFAAALERAATFAEQQSLSPPSDQSSVQSGSSVPQLALSSQQSVVTMGPVIPPEKTEEINITQHVDTPRRRGPSSLKVGAILLPLMIVSLLIGWSLLRALPGFFPLLHPTPTQISTSTTKRKVTVPMPPTQTSCPPQGGARAAVMAPLLLGDDQNIVYSASSGPYGQTTSVLKRYDVKTGKTAEIVKLPNMNILEAQISSDGQWVLFVSQVFIQAQQSFIELREEIQLVRMDGQGLQTLYCVSAPRTISGTLWSPDQHFIFFSENGTRSLSNRPSDHLFILYLLEVADGKLQRLLSTTDGTGYLPFEGSEGVLYMTEYSTIGEGIVTNTYGGDFYELGFDVGNLQAYGNPGLVTRSSPCQDYAISADSQSLFISRCSSFGEGGSAPPSSISVLPLFGNASAQTIFTAPQLAITRVRAISSATLLLEVQSWSSDHSQDGLWKIGTDGKGLTRLSTNSFLGSEFQYPWSNISRDGTMYMAIASEYIGTTATFQLFFSSLNGGALPTRFASDSRQYLQLIGWTTM